MGQAAWTTQGANAITKPQLPHSRGERHEGHNGTGGDHRSLQHMRGRAREERNHAPKMVQSSRIQARKPRRDRLRKRTKGREPAGGYDAASARHGSPRYGWAPRWWHGWRRGDGWDVSSRLLRRSIARSLWYGRPPGAMPEGHEATAAGGGAVCENGKGRQGVSDLIFRAVGSERAS